MTIVRWSAGPPGDIPREVPAVELTEGDVVRLLRPMRDGAAEWMPGTLAEIVAVSGRRGAVYYRLVLADGHQLTRDVAGDALERVKPALIADQQATAPVEWPDVTKDYVEQHDAAAADVLDAPLRQLREALVAGNLTHDCPACTGGQLRSGALCPLCEGWSHL